MRAGICDEDDSVSAKRDTYLAEYEDLAERVDLIVEPLRTRAPNVEVVERIVGLRIRECDEHTMREGGNLPGKTEMFLSQYMHASYTGRTEYTGWAYTVICSV